jgi:hypothetical protein
MDGAFIEHDRPAPASARRSLSGIYRTKRGGRSHSNHGGSRRACHRICSRVWDGIGCITGSILKAARPTAVNLAWAVDRVLSAVQDAKDIREAVIAEARAIFEEDVQANIQIGLNGLELVPQDARFIHHCNTGALATSGYGTALGVIRTAHEHGRNVFVYVDETRPRLQGSRLTAWELQSDRGWRFRACDANPGC